MKNIFLLSAICILFSSFSKPEHKGSVAIHDAITKEFPVNELAFKKWLVTMDIKNMEKFAGKKFTLKEKIGIKILQHKTKKELKKISGDKPGSKGKTSKILGIAGLVLLFVPYATLAALPLSIIAIIMGTNAAKENPKDKNARTGKILGWITLGLFTLFLIAALVFIAYSGFVF